MQVPLLDLKAQYAASKDEILAAVGEVLETQRCIGGPKVEELESQISKASNCKFGVGTSSGTDAILNSLMSLGIGPGDEVITTPFTFFATAGCIVRTGAKPVFVDIDPETYNIAPAKIEAAVTEKTWRIWTRSWILPKSIIWLLLKMRPSRSRALTKVKRPGASAPRAALVFFPAKISAESVTAG